ncbi:DUF1643 domain-containing protein [Cryobacterium sp. Hh7]|uniref:DUF1643 domain-containing protein n=1 Tax=Cryobacterium sp. Hh7 TaxID=1259159 RepID=UPI001068E96D|nr:DUF1643 domain-containing protein [Cryobacterium sp. Hh7]TFD53489.1 DUF1643 domain-containing protein [Cryobacterium sp. Hh7]
MTEVDSRAELSEDRTYRYRLSRVWSDGPRATFVMLNPSTADEYSDDPTLRRCIGFARHWGLGGLNVVNVYAFRATKPADLWTAADPIGPENNRYLEDAAANDEVLVAAWGAHAKQERVQEVLSIPGFDRLTCLRTTKRGYPSHPLYLPKELLPVPWPTWGQGLQRSLA